MKIAHINEIAGVAWRLAEAQRKLGHEAVVFTPGETPYRFKSDVDLQGAQGPLGWNAVMFANWRKFSEFDVIHVHGGIWRSQVFYPLFKKRFGWKLLAVHFHGSETRSGRGLFYIDRADLRFHSTPDLAQRLPKSVWIPNPVDLPELPPQPYNPVPRFGHFPTHPAHKGTQEIIEFFSRIFGPLKRESQAHVEKFAGREAELWVVSGTTHDEALRIMAGCDAVFDQISPYEAYGMVSIEAMAYGKPVFCTIRPESYPNCPIIPLLKEHSAEKLRAIAQDEKYRRECGRAGREYVERVHDAGKVARQVLRHYYVASERPAYTPAQAASYWRRRGRSYSDELASPEVTATYASQSRELLETLKSLNIKSVAEIGCGFGRIGQQLVDKLGVEWAGVDLSRSQLLVARRLNPQLKSSLAEASATSLPFPDNSFDLVLAVELLLHIPPEQIATATQELLRVARSYVVHLDWFEDYITGFRTGWCWVHDYPKLWQALGAICRDVPMESVGIQRVFIVSKSGRVPSH